jgi:hypothetical protein
VTTHSTSVWFEGKYGLMLRDAQVLPFRPWPGRLGFFEANP